jgi:hypothetical protein
MWHDDYGCDDYMYVQIDSGSGWTNIGGPYSRTVQGCPEGWVKYTLSIPNTDNTANFQFAFYGYCYGNTGAYNLHIDDVELYALEYDQTKYVDIDSCAQETVEFPEWCPCHWQMVFDDTVEYDMRACTMLENDELPWNDCEVYDQYINPLVIYFPPAHDVGDVEITKPEGNSGDACQNGGFEMCQTIKNYGQYDECCFNVWMQVEEMNVVPMWHEEFDCWEPDTANPPFSYRPCGWTEYHSPNYGYWGWENYVTGFCGGDDPNEAILAWFDLYPSYMTAELTTPAINTVGATDLILEFKSLIEHYESYFYTYMYIRGDTTEPWVRIEPWYYYITDDVPLETYQIDVSDHIGPNTQIRFRFYGYYYRLDWWVIDDVKFLTSVPGDIVYKESYCVECIDICEEQLICFPDWTPEPPSPDFCGEKDYLISSWTKLCDPPDENEMNDLKQKVFTVSFFHDVTINGFTKPEENALGPVIFSQPYGDYCTGPFSDEAQGYRVYDNFWGLSDDICDVHWWGLEAYGDDDPTGQEFEVALFPDDGGLPDFGNPTTTFTGEVGVDISFSDTGIDWYGFSLFKFECDIPCTGMSDGWLSVYRLDDGSGARFAWMDDGAATGDGAAYQDPAGWLTYDVSFELTTGDGGDPDLPTPDVYIPCGPQEVCVEVENLGTYDEDVDVNWELFQYPGPDLLDSGTVEEFIPCETAKEVCLFTYDFDEQGVYEVVVDVEADVDCDEDNNGPIQIYIGVDCCPPESSAVIDPEDPDGENNWYVSKVTVTVDAYDCCPPLVMSGVDYIVYEINGVPGQISGDSGTFTVEDDGVNFVEFYAVDKAGNEEAEHHTFEVAIDRTAPTVDLQHSESQDDGGQWSVTLTAIAGDATSGLNRVVFKVGANVLDTLYTPPWEITEVWQSGWGGETFSATAYDNAGNSAQDSAVITVSKDMSQTKSKTLVPTTINLLRLR